MLKLRPRYLLVERRFGSIGPCIEVNTDKGIDCRLESRWPRFDMDSGSMGCKGLVLKKIFLNLSVTRCSIKRFSLLVGCVGAAVAC
jgi:hypothetical protein